jgi:hypothetical protein
MHRHSNGGGANGIGSNAHREHAAASSAYWKDRYAKDFDRRCRSCNRVRINMGSEVISERERASLGYVDSEPLCIYCLLAPPSTQTLPSWVTAKPPPSPLMQPVQTTHASVSTQNTKAKAKAKAKGKAKKKRKRSRSELESNSDDEKDENEENAENENECDAEDAEDAEYDENENLDMDGTVFDDDHEVVDPDEEAAAEAAADADIVD